MKTKEGKPLKVIVEIEREAPAEKRKPALVRRYKAYWKWKGGGKS